MLHQADYLKGKLPLSDDAVILKLILFKLFEYLSYHVVLFGQRNLTVSWTAD